MAERTIQITELDRERLIKLILDAQSGEYRKSVYLENLRGELERVEVVPPEEIAGDVITMNSTVMLIDQDTGVSGSSPLATSAVTSERRGIDGSAPRRVTASAAAALA